MAIRSSIGRSGIFVLILFLVFSVLPVELAKAASPVHFYCTALSKGNYGSITMAGTTYSSGQSANYNEVDYWITANPPAPTSDWFFDYWSVMYIGSQSWVDNQYAQSTWFHLRGEAYLWAYFYSPIHTNAVTTPITWGTQQRVTGTAVQYSGKQIKVAYCAQGSGMGPPNRNGVPPFGSGNNGYLWATVTVSSGAWDTGYIYPTLPISLNQQLPQTYDVYALWGSDPSEEVDSNVVSFTLNPATPQLAAPTLTPGSIQLGQQVTITDEIFSAAFVNSNDLTGTLTVQVMKQGTSSWANVASQQFTSSYGYSTKYGQYGDYYDLSVAWTPPEAALYDVRITYGGNHYFVPINSASSPLTVGQPTYNVALYAHCNTESADVGVAITKDSSPTGFITPHTFTGLTGPHTFTVPGTDPSGHAFKQWSTGETTTTITVSGGGTYTAYYEQPPPTYQFTVLAHCNTENTDVSVSMVLDDSPPGHPTPYTFTSTIATHKFTVPSTDSSGHPFKQWSTGDTTTSITVSAAGTYTAYYEQPTPTYHFTIQAYCNSEGAGVGVGITMDDSPTGYNTPHTFTTTVATHTFTVPSTDPSGHPFKQWSTGNTERTIAVTSEGTFIAYFEEVGNLQAFGIEALQTTMDVAGTDLVQDKPTTFRIVYYSSFQSQKAAYVRIDLQGFDYSEWTFKVTFKFGTHVIWLHSEDLKAPVIKPTTKSVAKFKVTLDVFSEVTETSEDDNIWPPPYVGMVQRKVYNTNAVRVLFVRLHHVNEPDNWRITYSQAYRYKTEAWDFFTATYPVAPYEVTFELSSERLIVGNEFWVDINWILEQLRGMASGYDKVVGVASDWPGWANVKLIWWSLGQPNTWGTSPGITGPNEKKAVIVKNIAPMIVAHEIGHTYGLADDYITDAQGNVVGSITDDTCDGYWVSKAKEIARAYSFMDALDTSDTYWVEKGDYKTLLANPEIRALDPEVIQIGGTISKNGTASLDENLYRANDGMVTLEDSSGNYYIILSDGIGNVLSRTGFNVTFFLLSDPPVEVEEESFCFSIGWINGTRTVELRDDHENVLASRYVSQNAPSVQIIAPNGNEIVSPGMNYTIAWSAVDSDGDSLTYNILISNGTDSIPIPIATDINQTSFTYDFADFPGGTQYLMYIYATDGVNVGYDISDSYFSISGFTIDVVTSSQTVTQGGKINFTMSLVSHGGFAGQVTLNASSMTGNFAFRWVEGENAVLTSGGSVTKTLVVEAVNSTGGSHMIVVLAFSGNTTLATTANLYVEDHDVAILSIAPFKTVVPKGLEIVFNVTVQNHGSYSEEFNVCFYDNSTLIAAQSVCLHAGTTSIAAIVWNTTSLAFDNYSIAFSASSVSNETDTGDNTLNAGVITVSGLGDINGDFVVDIYDAILLAGTYNSVPGSSNWKTEADINSDGIVDIYDAIILAGHYGEHYP